MGLEKAIASGKEHRKPYRGSKSFDAHCRNGNLCQWCNGNRTVKNRKREEAAKDKEQLDG